MEKVIKRLIGPSVVQARDLKLYVQELRQNLKEGLCIECKRPALEHCYSETGRKEVAISGLCEECWDKIMSPTD